MSNINDDLPEPETPVTATSSPGESHGEVFQVVLASAVDYQAFSRRARGARAWAACAARRDKRR